MTKVKTMILALNLLMLLMKIRMGNLMMKIRMNMTRRDRNSGH